MSQYEFTFLLADEKEAEKIEELIKSQSAKILNKESWGKKDLAYSIKKNLSAFYFNWKFDIGINNLKELRTKLTFNEKILRYLLLKI